jgi:hypothetical protein
VLLLALLAARASADSIPVNLQAAILAKMLAYDRALKTRVGPAIDVGVVFKESDKASTQAGTALVKAFEAMHAHRVQGLPLRPSGHAYKGAEPLAQWMKTEGIDLVCVVSGLDKERDVIRGASLEAKAVSVGADRAQVEGGLAVAVVLRGATPRILVNVPSVEAVGVDLDPKLLQLSDVIR